MISNKTGICEPNVVSINAGAWRSLKIINQAHTSLINISFLLVAVQQVLIHPLNTNRLLHDSGSTKLARLEPTRSSNLDGIGLS
jgi:hypothetical protein